MNVYRIVLSRAPPTPPPAGLQAPFLRRPQHSLDAGGGPQTTPTLLRTVLSLIRTDLEITRMYPVPLPNKRLDGPPRPDPSTLSRCPHLTCSCSVSAAFLSLSTCSKVFPTSYVRIALNPQQGVLGLGPRQTRIKMSSRHEC